MRLKRLRIVLCLSILTMLVGCGKTETNMTEEEMVQLETEIIEIQMESDYVSDEMYERATAFIEGDVSRLVATMKKAQNGEEITIAVIGGSITERYSASTYGNCYASHLHNWWIKRFPDTKVNFINAGIGGTSSYLGVHRIQKDILDKKPDLVVVEFSVNDGNNIFYKKSYDNLVRKILKEEYNPGVMLLFTTQENGTNAQENDALIGFRYRLPMISYGNAVLPAIDNDEFTWKDISPDTVHPNDRGHAIIGELFYRYFNDLYARLDEIDNAVQVFDEKAVTKETYLNASIFNNKDIVPIHYGSFENKNINTILSNNWHTSAGEEGIVFEVEAKNIGLVYLRTIDGSYGKYDVIIDGEQCFTLDGNFENGWGSTIETIELLYSE